MFIFRELHPPLLEQLRLRLASRDGTSWTALMDELLCELAEQQPSATPARIRHALARIPVLDHMLDAARLAAGSPGAVLAIVSDANSVYIESMLEHHALAGCVREVVTNPAAFDGPRLRVQPFHALHLAPHGCTDCPANMCKGRILDRLRGDHGGGFAHVLYVGDGSGDFCPSTRLGAHDVVFARADDADGKSYGLLKKVRASPERVQARVVPWRSGEDIFHHFQAFFQSLDT
ncbi:hypothetical protein PybrP1_007532 [[Pythium] brassicae (nom. inval.)]|nr:hypothetical protein PybrP1_007532 [[Pythium] brassicae (nom. inval.)]